MKKRVRNKIYAFVISFVLLFAFVPYSANAVDELPECTDNIYDCCNSILLSESSSIPIEPTSIGCLFGHIPRLYNAWEENVMGSVFNWCFGIQQKVRKEVWMCNRIGCLWSFETTTVIESGRGHDFVRKPPTNTMPAYLQCDYIDCGFIILMG
jgi:hypothetical protein